MIRPKPSTTVIGDLLGRRWVGFGYATFALAVLVLAALPVANVVMRFPVALFMIALALATPATGMLLGRGRRARNRPLALALLLVDGLAALGLIAVTGGASSPLWVALMLVSTATPLLLRGRWAAGLLGGVWLADGLFLLYVPADQLVPALLTWALRAAGVGLIGLVLYRSLSIEEGVRTRAQRRESVLHDFLELSNRLRVTSKPGQVLEEVALAVQRSGEFDCVTLSQVDWRAGVATVTVAIGASGRRLKAVEGLTFTWDKLAPLLAERRRAGPNTFRAEILPFRTIKSEQHLVMPLNSQFSEIQGLLTVSAPRQRQDALLHRAVERVVVERRGGLVCQ